MIPVGPFSLLAPIGSGGMGQVWAADHVDSGRRVAVKVLTELRATDRRFRRAFRNEARAVAALSHPHIVGIHDVGEIDEEASRASANRLVAGAPYLVMEFVGGGTLSDRRGLVGWAELRAILNTLLDALAHAHARGVVHRDLKPGNVLVGQGAQGLKLGDFGLAKSMAREGLTVETTGNAVGGTPAYMAPEQFSGTSRDVGPWSDLYALGCLVFSLVQGDPPYGRKPWISVANGHLFGEIPSLGAGFRAPAGFDAWLRRMLAKDPHARYRRAADAAWDLSELEDPTEEVLRPVALAPVSSTDDTILRRRASSSTSLAGPGPTTLVWDPRDRPDLGASAPSRVDVAPLPAPRAPPPIPFSWRRVEPPDGGSALLGTALYEARSIPMVGREEERDTLWRALRGSRRRGRTKVVVLRGPAGCGKTRLAEWLCQRAHEIGAVDVLHASHGPIGARSDGLGAMLVRYFRAWGLPRDELNDRVSAQLRQLGVHDPELLQEVAEVVAPATANERTTGIRSLRFVSSVERHAAIARVLVRLATERPLVLWLDDAQWGLDSLEFALHLSSSQANLPALVLITVRDEALPPRSAEAEVLAEILEDEHAEPLVLGPLPAPDHQALVRGLLGLAPELAAKVEERTAGNPQFAVRLVGDWVQRALLEPTERGWQLRRGARIDLPDDLHQVWSATVARLLTGRPSSDGAALELAAVLGPDVVTEEWARVCERAGIRPSSGLVERLLAARLARSVDPEREWSFSHEMLRESLLRRARDAGRWEAHHLLCAEVARDAEGGDGERVARFLVGGGQPERAVELLLAAASARLDLGELRAAGALLAERDRVLSELAPGPDDRWARGWVQWSRLERGLQRFQVALGHSGRALDAARASRQSALALDALREHGANLLALGRYDAAERAVTEGLQIGKALMSPRRMAELSGDLGAIALARGQLDRAGELFQEAVVRYRNLGDPSGAAAVWMGLCELGRRAGQLEHAVLWAEHAREGFQQQGARAAVAAALALRAELLRMRVLFDGLDASALLEAEAALRDAASRFEGLGGSIHVDRGGARVSLALTWLAMGRYEDARSLLAQCRADAAVMADAGLGARVEGASAVCAAWRGDWPEVDRRLVGLVERVVSHGRSELDLADLAERVGTLAGQAGQGTRATRALEIALELWTRSARPERDRVRVALAASRSR